jgi:hypothetical protein
MPDPDPNPWREAHTTARALHDTLLRLGISETVLSALTARQDATGVMRVVVPPLPLADANRLIAALGPHLSRDRAPTAIGHP